MSAEEETTPANVQTVSDDELETLRKHKGHGGHHGHDGHDGDDGDDDDNDSDDRPEDGGDGQTPAPMTPEEKRDLIQRLAYKIWETHKGNGRDVEDWLQSESLVNQGMLDIASLDQ